MKDELMKDLYNEEIDWIKSHPNEFLKEFLDTLELTKKFVPQLLHLRDSGNKEEYSKEFKRLLQIEREKQKKYENEREID
jgi:hypothetical protein